MAGCRMGELHTMLGFTVGIGYVVEVEAVDKGKRTMSTARGGVHETGA